MLPFQGTEDLRSRIVASLGATPIERTRRFWLGALTFGIWTRKHPAPVSPAPPQPAPARPTRSAWGWVVAIVFGTVVIAAIAASAGSPHRATLVTSRGPTPSAAPSSMGPSPSIPPPHASKRPARHHTSHHRSPLPHRTPTAAVAHVCWAGNPLRGVYHPYRLEVLGACRRFTGTVIAVRPEDDGDHHVIIRPAPGFAGMLDHDNYSEQHGGIVAEIMPGQHLVPPYVGEHVTVVGTWAYDSDHGWNEIHPIWAIDYGQGLVKSLPPATPVYEPESDGGLSGGGSGGGAGSTGGSNCTSGYSPCLIDHGGVDYDCAGGGGDGPYFTKPGVVYHVTGSDPYRLDGNNDGLGCE
jgi:hypothetical protein